VGVKLQSLGHPVISSLHVYPYDVYAYLLSVGNDSFYGTMSVDHKHARAVKIRQIGILCIACKMLI